MKKDLKIVLDNLNHEDLSLVIQYGSSVGKGNGMDIDLFVVERGVVGEESIVFGKLDIIRIGMRTFIEMIDKRDPAYASEPILTGKLLLGDKEEFQGVKTRLREKTSADLRYLAKISSKEYYKAQQFLDNEQLLKALRSLSFSLSYKAFNNWYYNNSALITWEKLKECIESKLRKLIEKLNQALDEGKRGNKLDKKEVENIFVEINNFLLNFSVIIEN